jgi:hypothetical protein
MIFLNLRLNKQFGLPTFHIINFQSLIICEIQIWSQTLFFLFLGSWFEREERKWLDSDGLESKSRLRSIPATKTGDFGVNRFLLMGRVYLRCFLLKTCIKW